MDNSSPDPNGNITDRRKSAELFITRSLEHFLSAKNKRYFDLMKKVLTETIHNVSTDLNNLLFCVEDIIKNNIEGDLLEAGVRHSGTNIFMKSILNFHNIKDKKIIISDSAQAFLEEANSNFEKFNMLDEQVVFLDSLKNLTSDKLSLLSFAGDDYDSAGQTLENLYNKLSEGGYIIINDYNLPGCKSAVDDFRKNNNIQEPIKKINETSIYWKKDSKYTYSSVSVCLIVKDDGKYLINALESVKEIANEIIIVDINFPPAPLLQREGGKDSHPFHSQSVRQENGPIERNISSSPLYLAACRVRSETVPKLYEFPWNNDFSEVRNFAAEQASKGWVLLMNADQTLSEDSIKLLPAYLSRQDISVYYTKVIVNKLTVKELDSRLSNIYSSVNLEQLLNLEGFESKGLQYLEANLFRSDKGIRYQGRVFERIEKIEELVSENSDIKILTHNYTEELKEKKLNARKELLQLSLEKDKLNTLQILYYQAKLLSQQINSAKKFKEEQTNNLKEQIILLNRQIETIKEKDKFHFWYYDAAEILINYFNDSRPGFEILIQGISYFHSSIKLLFLFAGSIFKIGKAEEAKNAFNYIAHLLKDEKALLSSEINVESYLLDPDPLNFIIAIINFELNNYQAFQYFSNQIKEPDKYHEPVEKLNNKLKYHLSILNYLKHKAEKEESNKYSALLYLKLAREYLKELQYEKSLDTYLTCLDLAQKENNQVIEQLIYNDFIANAKQLVLDTAFIENIISKIKQTSYSFYYSLGRYYLTTGNAKQAIYVFETALQLKDNKNAGFIDTITFNNHDPFLHDQILKNLQLAKKAAPYPVNDILLHAVHYYHLKDFSKASELFLSIKVNQLNNYQKFLLYDYLALINERNEDYARAESYLKSALAALDDFEISTRLNTINEHKYWKIIRDMPDGIEMYQVKSEWVECLKEIDKLMPDVVVEIGTYKGGTLYTISEFSKKNAILVSIDMPGGDLLTPTPASDEDFIRLKKEIKRNRPDQEVYILREDSHKNETLLQLKDILKENSPKGAPDSEYGIKKIDVLFIDGDHTYDGVKQDYLMYSSLVSQNGIIIFHDILEHQNPQICQVDKFWKEIIQKHATKEFIYSINQGWAGIGIILNKKPEQKIYDRYNFVQMHINFGKHVVTPIYYENMQLFKHAFDDLGIEYKFSNNQLCKEYNNILFLPYSKPALSNYLLDYTYFIFQLEQLTKDILNQDFCYNGYLRMLKSAAGIWDYSKLNIECLNSINFTNVSHLPFGFHPKMEVLDFNKEKTIDVLFYGSLNKEREIVINELIKREFRVKHLFNVFGKERNDYIERSKIILNIHRSPDSLLEEHRLSFLINNRCFVISEAPAANQENPYGDGIVYSTYEKLADTCEYYLKPEQETLRKQIAEKGYNHFSNFKMTDFLRKVIKSQGIL